MFDTLTILNTRIHKENVKYLYFDLLQQLRYQGEDKVKTHQTGLSSLRPSWSVIAHQVLLSHDHGRINPINVIIYII